MQKTMKKPGSYTETHGRKKHHSTVFQEQFWHDISCMIRIEVFRNRYVCRKIQKKYRKIQSIIKAGRPQNNEDVKSVLQTCQFNATFMGESEQAYVQITAPLRALTRKNVKFQWTRECEEAYKDAKTNVKSHNIRKGHNVLLLQKGTKTQSRYDPHPYRVSDVIGTQNTGHKIRTRDAKMFKVSGPFVETLCVFQCIKIS